MDVTLKCRVVTPMFMAGADGQTPELRPSEFKGMMRFWWRAIKAEDNIEQLKREETEIFGGTGETGCKSKINLRLSHNYSLIQKYKGTDIRNDYKLKWNFNSEERTLTGIHSGIGYLLYSTTLKGPGREFIKDGFTFEILLSSFHDEALKEALASLWLAIYLGGFGTRARRGGGNLVIDEIEPRNTFDIDFICSVKNKNGLKEWLASNLTHIKNNVIGKDIKSTNTKKYSVLAGSKLLIFDHENSWIDALNLLGKRFSEFRHKNRSKVFETAAFGMPVMHRGFRMVPYKHDGRLSERFASPLIFKVIESEDLYFPILLRLNCDIPKVGKEERNKGWKLVNSRGQISQNLIEEFLAVFKDAVSKDEALEVSL